MAFSFPDFGATIPHIVKTIHSLVSEDMVAYELRKQSELQKHLDVEGPDEMDVVLYQKQTADLIAMTIQSRLVSANERYIAGNGNEFTRHILLALASFCNLMGWSMASGVVNDAACELQRRVKISGQSQFLSDYSGALDTSLLANMLRDFFKRNPFTNAQFNARCRKYYADLSEKELASRVSADRMQILKGPVTAEFIRRIISVVGWEIVEDRLDCSNPTMRVAIKVQTDTLSV